MLLDLVKADTGSAQSALGQTRRFRDARRMSGLPPTADISGASRHFAFGPNRTSLSEHASSGVEPLAEADDGLVAALAGDVDAHDQRRVRIARQLAGDR